MLGLSNSLSLIANISFIGAGLLGLILAIVVLVQRKQGEKKTGRRIADMESRANSEPGKTKPAWDVARVTLEEYFNRNLNQLAEIFWLSVIVMVFGFGIILLGVRQSILSPDKVSAALITALSGVLTEFIGATFLVLYRSIMKQALQYTTCLERMNSVGMAMQILDTIPDNAAADSLKDSTKVEVVKMLMQQANTPAIDPTAPDPNGNQ
jgi:nitrate reductase gamma subunit